MTESQLSPDDARSMAYALRLARATWPGSNPRVGAVIVKNGRIIGRGKHLKAGGPHAEVYALAEAGEDARGATLYVTLEPCCHFGRTAPCSRAIISAGISRVVAGCEDPNPKVSGQGFAELRAAGIKVVVGARAAEAERLIAGHTRFMRSRLPYVTWKYAMSLDGKIATARGESHWISGEASRREVHRMRRDSDAVLIGVGTALADDPELSVRHVRSPHQPMRVICDSRGRLPSDARVLRSPGGSTIVFVSALCSPANRERLSDAGAHVAECGQDTVDPGLALRALAEDYSVREVLLESGPQLASALLEAGLINEAVCFISGKLIGGLDSPGPLGGHGATPLSSVPHAEIIRTRRFGTDVALYARLKDVSNPPS